MLRLDLHPQATNASAEQDQMLRWDQDPQATNAITSAMEPQVEEPDEGSGEAAVCIQQRLNHRQELRTRWRLHYLRRGRYQ